MLLRLHAMVAASFMSKPSWQEWGTAPNGSEGLPQPLAGDAQNDGLNLLDGQLHRHHPVMRAISIQAYRFDWNNIIELNGLKVPAHYDCNNFNGGRPWTGKHDYFGSVPSRWLTCHLHEAQVKSGLPVVVPQLPLIDEEYAEHVAVFQSVLRAHRGGRFIMAEIGARWGPWGARAAALARAKRPDLSHSLYFVEPDSHGCHAIREVAQMNKLNSHVVCARASSATFMQWASGQQHIDVVDIDVQGYEQTFVPEVASVLSQKAFRVIVGTHGVMGNEVGLPRNACIHPSIHHEYNTCMHACMHAYIH